LGEEPDPDKMPLSTSVFPEEVQAAFFVFDLMPDRWDGMSGVYLGKEWSSFEYIVRVYDMDNSKDIFFFAKIYESLLVSYRSKKSEEQRKAEERKQKSSSGGQSFTHNVKG